MKINNKCISKKDIQLLRIELEKLTFEWLCEETVDIEICKDLKNINGFARKDANKRDKFTIYLSCEKYQKEGIEKIIENIYHHFAHIIDFLYTGKTSHDKKFQDTLKLIGGEYSSIEEYTACGVSKDLLVNENVKWKLVCPKCGNTIYRKKLTKKLLEKKCGLCGKGIDKFQKNNYGIMS